MHSMGINPGRLAALFLAASCPLAAFGQDGEMPAEGGAGNAGDAGGPAPDGSIVVDDSPDTDWHGMFGPVRIGPTFALAIPHPINFGLEAKVFRYLGLGFGYGFLPETTLADVKVKANAWRVSVRGFPWGESFFAGLNFGAQTLKGSAKTDVSTTVNGVRLSAPVKGTLDFESGTIVPHIGWMSTSASGLTIGTEFGVQFATSPESKVDARAEGVSAAQEALLKNTQEYKDTKKDLEDAAKKYGKQPLPYWTIIRLGWLF